MPFQNQGLGREMHSLAIVSPKAPSENETLYQTLFKISPFPLCITDMTDHKFMLVNPIFCKMTGYHQDEVIGHTIDELGFFSSPGEYRKILERLIRDGEIKDYQIRAQRNGYAPDCFSMWLKKIRYESRDCVLTMTRFNSPEIDIQQALRHSDKRFNTILSSINDSYYEMDLEGRFTFFNDSLAALFGLDRELLMGSAFRDYTSEEDAGKIMHACRKVVSSNRKIDFVAFGIRRRDGTALHLEVSVSLLRGGMGQIIGYNGIVRDRTEQYSAEKNLRRNEEKYRRILGEMEEGYYEIDLQGNLIYFNRAIPKIHGYPASEMINMNFRQYLNPEQAEMIHTLFNEIFETGIPVKFHEYEIIRKDGSICMAELSAYPLRDPEGDITGFWGITRDRTEKRKAEIAIRESEEKYRNILEEMEEGYYEIDLNGDLNYFNKAIPKIHGYSADELLHMNYRQYLSSQQAQKVEKIFYGVYTSGRHCRINDHEIIQKDGSIRTTEVTAYPMRDAKGETKGFWGITRDRTEQKKAEMALRKNEEQYRLLVNNANDAIYITCDDRIRYHNPKTAQITGYSSDVLMEMTFADLVHPHDRETIWEAQRRKLKEGQNPAAFVFRILDKNGEVLWVELNAINISWQGRPAILNFLRDVTHLKNTEARLLQAQKMEALGTLAGGIAHDFNNILSAILGYTELARREIPADGKAADDLNEVVIAGHRAKDLVHQILAYARQTDEQVGPVMVSVIAREALKLIRSSIPSTIQIIQDIRSNAATMGNPTQIHQIVMNLCTNAAHAMEESGGILSVSLSQVRMPEAESLYKMRPGAYLALTVSDTGKGIAPEILDAIFDPYFTTKSPGEGTGMGLSVVQGIVEKYGGKIFVESKPAQGSKFTAYLPITETVTQAGGHNREKISTGKEHILLVDDEPAIVKLVSRMLKKLGYAVTPLTSSVEALDLFRQQPERFDLVITDMTMPGLTGDLLAGEMIRIRPDLPVVLCTGYNKKIDEKIATDMGIKAFVFKPISEKELAETVRRAIDDRTAAEDAQHA